MSALSILTATVFAGAAGLSLFGIGCSLYTHRHAIVAALRGRPLPPRTPADHWGELHLSADRRAPFFDLSRTPEASTAIPRAVSTPSRGPSRPFRGQQDDAA